MIIRFNKHVSFNFETLSEASDSDWQYFIHYLAVLLSVNLISKQAPHKNDPQNTDKTQNTENKSPFINIQSLETLCILLA